MFTPYKFSRAFNFQPLKTLGEAEATITEENIAAKIAVLTSKSAYWSNALIWINDLICQAYGIDAPWAWHLSRLLKNSPGMEAGFKSEGYIKTFLPWYIGVLNASEKIVEDETGISFSFRSNKCTA